MEIAPAAEQEDVAAGLAYKRRRPNLNFEEMNVPMGSELRSVVTADVAVVVGPRLVRVHEREMSLTEATRLVKGLDYSVAPGPWWLFNGRRISDIYEETYQLLE